MSDFRAELLADLRAAATDPQALTRRLAPGADVEVSRPLAPMRGPEAVEAAWMEPLRHAFTGLHRRDAILIGGTSYPGKGGYGQTRPADGFWCAGLCHWVGTFERDLWGIPASGKLAMLRTGEAWGLDAEGRVHTARIIHDLPDLILQGGRNPFGASLGTELAFPPPATLDGVLPDPEGAEASLALAERMLGNLHVYDPVTGNSEGQTGKHGAWADGMLWWGPAGIGSNHRWEGFVADHRAPFLRAFPDREGGNHYCRIGDGDYAFVSGWPSMTMSWGDSYLGAGPADGRSLNLRVMDFYRMSGGRIAENWVMLDYTHLFEQMGRDLIAEARG